MKSLKNIENFTRSRKRLKFIAYAWL